MSAAELAQAVADYRDAQLHLDQAKASVITWQQQLKTAREELERAIVEEAIDGARMKDLVAATGLSREWLRQLLRRNGVNPEE